MDELKPCLLDQIRDYLHESHTATPENIQAISLLWAAYDGIKYRRAAPENKSQQLCSEDENFIQTKFGYCFYTFDVPPMIYNLYVHPQYRRCGHSRKLLKLVIAEIKKSGYEGEIRIEAEPRENSIRLANLMRYYKSMGLTVCDARKPEGSDNP